MSLERNLMIEAGAGTGKTTRLVKAILQALFIRQLPLESIVALTFTNKAAGELKERVGIALDDILLARTIDELRAKPWWPTPAPSLPLTDLQTLATTATGVLDRANISTIHSFAFAILKRFPLAAGIDPNAAIDDKKLRFDELFGEEWPRWLAVELGEAPPREAQWLELLSKMALSEVTEAAQSLADFVVPLEKLRIPLKELAQRLKTLHEESRTLAGAHPGTLNADKLARAVEEVLGGAKDTVEDLTLKPGKPKAWSKEELERLIYLQAVAKNVQAGGDKVIALLTEILEPFIKKFRERLLTEGCLTHAALLYLSREIVKNNPDIRETLKRDIGLILIDEFQDTDPLQAELLLYLAEKSENHATAWDKVKLAAGKLFIVGDPKQSIYRFRGADIAAYERIGKLLVEQGGAQETLEVNYRSQGQVIHIVNQAFKNIITPVPEISPPYIAITPHHEKEAAHDIQDVALWLADSTQEQSVEEAQATEAEHIAQWIKEHKGRMTVHDPREGARRPLLYRDVALIFRTYSPMDRYVEALRRHNIPFAVESERYFFTTPEVTDFINFLRAADDPTDTLSLVGFLRSPMGGLTDDEILKRRNANTLESAEQVLWLRGITTRLQREPLTDVLLHIFNTTWLMEMAARSYHGDQTVANLLKLGRLLEGFAAEGLTTMARLIKKLEEFFADDTIEGESPLADENYNAVRLLTIHKAKGLEFPVVFLPSLHSGLKEHATDSCVFDWRSQTLGLEIAGFCNLDKLELDSQTRRREAAEQNRILYVAMTRARERLVLCGGVNLKASSSKAYLQRLLESLNQSLESLKEGEIRLDNATLSVRRLERVTISADSPKIDTENPLAQVDPVRFAQVWKQRAALRQKAEQTVLVQHPTGTASPRDQSFMGAWPSSSEKPEGGSPAPSLPSSPAVVSGGPHPALLGTLVHRFLEKWDFQCKKCDMPAFLREVAKGLNPSSSLAPANSSSPAPANSSSPAVVSGGPNHSDLIDQAQKLLADFIGSPAFNEIQQGEILGREVPFFYKTAEGSLMRGTMDILYRTPAGELVVGDYKTGSPKDPDQFKTQSDAYLTAIERALGEEARFKLIFLRAKEPLSAKAR